MSPLTLLSPCFRPGRILVVTAFLLSAGSALAWPWRSEPQPVLEGREAIRADAGSPLAWDDSGRRLWYILSDNLHFARWTLAGFKTGGTSLRPRASAGLLVDSGLHQVFYVNVEGFPQVARFVRGQWVAEQLGEEKLSRWLAVDSRRHVVFGYDAVARGIRSYSYVRKTKTWLSAIVADGLGEAADGGVFDPVSQVLYTTHADADAEVPRHPGATPIGDPTGEGLLQPWPLVRTAWDGTRWNAQILDETGVSQQPAVRGTDHRVFYAKRDALRDTYFYQLARRSEPDVFGSVEGWSGTDTFEDHDRYTIRAPQYPASWTGAVDFYRGVITISQSGGVFQPQYIVLQGPITLVPIYEPIFSDTALVPRLASFRALINPRQSRLIQHRLHHEGEVLRRQVGAKISGYLYRDATGKYGTRIATAREVTVPFQSSPVLAAVRNFPELGPDFDPSNPPPEFAELNDPAATFMSWIEASPLSPIPLDPDAPYLSPEVRLPKLVEARTFGHAYRSTLLDQPGSRHRTYRNFGTSFAVPSGMAVDRATGVTFYTQAPAPAANEGVATPPLWPSSSISPDDFFHREPDLKIDPAGSLSRWVETPVRRHVWIVMVY